MLKSIDNKYCFQITKMNLINHGAAFLRVICCNIQIDKATSNAIKNYQRWGIEGYGNFFKTKIHPVFKVNTHVPDNLGVATLTYDLVVELYFPPGEIEINFGPIPPTPLPLPSSSSSQSIISGLTPIFVPVEEFRDFENLDVDNIE